MATTELRKLLPSSALLLAAYWLWLFLCHLVGMSLVTYGMLDSTPGVQEIADQYFANYWTIQGWGSLAFFLLSWGLSISNPTPWNEMNGKFWKAQVAPNFLRAAAGATLFILTLMAFTPFQYLGPGFSWTDGPWGVLNWASRSIAWWGWALGDELVFRKLLLPRLRDLFRSHAETLAIVITTALWVLTRSLHQPLGWSQTLTLTLLGLILGLRVTRGRHYLGGAALLAGSTWVFQALFSLPLLGQEYPGIWMIKFSSAWADSHPWLRLLSGGAGGPGASALLQLFLLGVLVRILWTTPRGSLR
jgi:hypothetical protein